MDILDNGSLEGLWALNHYGYAKHFKIRGDFAVDVGWTQGEGFSEDDVTMGIITGNMRSSGFPTWMPFGL